MEASPAVPIAAEPHEEGGDTPPGPVVAGRHAHGVPAGRTSSHTVRESGRVLVLNASYEPLNVCTVRRAVVLILKEKAELLEQGDRKLHSETMTLPAPVVI